MVQKHAGFVLSSEGRVVRKPCERLSGHGSSPLGEESEALNRAAFDSLGQKQRAFELLCLSYSNGFFTTSLSFLVQKKACSIFPLLLAGLS
jgi:hypothetical protein